MKLVEAAAHVQAIISIVSSFFAQLLLDFGHLRCMGFGKICFSLLYFLSECLVFFW
jgi:hypothetical protein